MLAQIAYFGFRMGEISCPTHYSKDSSSINFARSVRYGLGVLKVSIQYRLAKLGLSKKPIFLNQKTTLNSSPDDSTELQDVRTS